MKKTKFTTRTNFLLLLCLFIGTYAHAGDRYWVGNSGNWNDPSHWSASSGGAGGVGVPDQGDNVFFNSASFGANAVIQITGNVACKNFNWTGNQNRAKLTGQGTMMVYGSLIIDEAIRNYYSGDIILMANSGKKEIRAGKNELKGNLIIRGGATFGLTDKLWIDDSKGLILENGRLNANGYEITLGSFETKGNEVKKMDISGSTVNVNRAWNAASGTNNIFYTNGALIGLSTSIGQEYIERGTITSSSYFYRAPCTSPPIDIDFTVTITSDYNGADISCQGACDGEFTVAVTMGGGGPYGFVITKPGFSFTQGETATDTSVISGLCSGNYTIKVIDSSQVVSGSIYYSCSKSGFILTPPDFLSIDVYGIVNPSCPDSCDGQILSNIGGGTGVLSILWPSIDSNITDSPTGACRGWHRVEVEDENGCSLLDSVQMSDPPTLLDGVVLTPITCFNDCDATGTASPSGGNGAPFANLLWTEIVSGDTISQAALAAGLCADSTYTFYFEDKDGCPSSQNYTISNKPEIIVTETANDTANCYGTCNAGITISVVGGTGNDSINWYLGVPGSATPHDVGTLNLSQNNLCADSNYFVVVYDNGGCADTTLLTMPTGPNEIFFNAAIGQITCNGYDDGTIDLSPSGGSGTYFYDWDSDGLGDADDSQDTINLAPGTYCVRIFDANVADSSCFKDTCIIIVEPDGFQFNGVLTDITCFSLTDGTINQTVTGGTPAYTFSWTGPVGFIDPGTEDLAGLAQGTYVCTVTDANLCSDDTTYTITEPLPITANATVTQPTCNASDDGRIIFAPANGTAPYGYNWGAGFGPVSDSANLVPGVYTVTIRDVNGCVIVPDTSITITAPPAITIGETHTNITCAGFDDGTIDVVIGGGTPALTWSWNSTCGTWAGAPATDQSNLIGLCAGDYEVVVTDANLCQDSLTITITEPPALDLAPVVTNVTCFGGNDGAINLTVTGGYGVYDFDWGQDASFESEDTLNLVAGTYCLSVYDNAEPGCFIDTCWDITEPTRIIFDGTIVTDSCFGADGTIELNVNGGVEPYTSIVWDAGNPTAIPVDDTSGTNLISGNYLVTVTDASGCTMDTTMTLTDPSAISILEVHTDATCFGYDDGTITATISGGTPVLTWFWTSTCGTWAGGPATDQSNLTGLCPGDYEVFVTDANLCQDSLTITITEPTAFDLSPVVVNATCFGDNDGSINLTVTGGSGTYDFDWGPDATFESEDTLNLVAGNYCLRIIDNAQPTCFMDTCWDITEPARIIFDGTIVTDSCNGADGTIELNVNGGVEPYASIIWDAGNPSVIANGDTSGTNLISGSYLVTVTDASGCTMDTTITLTDPSAISILEAHTDVTCFGFDDGTITATISGGTPALTWFWTSTCGTWAGGPATDQSNLTGLCPGDYEVFVTDANLCQDSLTITIAEPTAIDLAPVVTNVDCFGNNTGAINLTVTGGSGTYDFDWGQDATFESEDTLNLVAGTYCLFIYDNAQPTCFMDTCWDVTEPARIIFDGTIVTDSCFGADGTIELNVNGGVEPYASITWDAGNPTAIPLNDTSGTNLVSGSYLVTVLDANGCTMDTTMTLTDPTAITYTLDSVDANCGVDDGVVSVVAANGTAPYTYDWDTDGTGDFDDNDTITGLAVGCYTVTIMDANLCQVTSTPICVINSTAPAVTYVIVDESCPGACDGSITPTITGSAPPYVTTWSSAGACAAWVDPGTDPIFDLCACDYTFIVTDTNNCTFTSVETVSSPSNVTTLAVLTNVSCFGGSDGAIDLTASGGTPNVPAPAYTYLWTGPGAYSSASEDISGLILGTYCVTIRDGNGCTFDTCFTLTEGTEITTTFNTQDATCGFSDGLAAVVAAGGNGVYTYDWNLALDPWDNNFDDNDTITGLNVGTYSVIVQDGLGCVDTSSVSISNATGPTITVDSSTNVTCNGLGNGAIYVTPTGGTAPLVVTWQKLLPAPGPVVPDLGDTSASNLTPGTYEITVTDAGTCADVITVVITQPTVLSSPGVVTHPLCVGINGSINVSVTGGNPPYLFDWDGDGYDDGEDTSAVAGTYSLFVLDSLGCADTATFTLTDPAVLSALPDSIESSCGNADGSVIIAPSGGTPGYTFSWSQGGGPVLGVNDTLSNVAAGCYDVTVTDANGCTFDTTACVVDAASPSVVFTLNHNTCNGGSTGSILIAISNGTPPYNTVWTSTCPSFVDPGTDNIFALEACNYTLTLTDANGCTFVSTQTITEPASITTTAALTHVLCFDDNTGAIDLTPSGGTPIVPAPAYTYSWTGPGAYSASTEDITNLVDGTYNVTITDANACTFDTSFVITETTDIVLTSGSVDAQCGINDGAAGVTVAGGSGPYTYQWYNPAIMPGEINDTLFNVGAGSYKVVVTDALGCLDSITVAVSNTNAPVITIDNIQHVTCFGQNNGEIYTTATGIALPLTYSWDILPDPGDTSDVEGLIAGDYTLTVTDNSGCQTIQIITINEPALFDLPGVISHPSCNGDDGCVDLLPTGGTGPYTFDWSMDGTTDYDDVEDPCMAAGSWTVNALDAQGCSATNTFVLVEPSLLALTGNTIGSTCGNADGAAIVSASGGTVAIDYSYNWYNMGVYAPLLQTNDTMNNVAAGCYDAIVLDDNGCTDTITVCVGDVDGPVVTETHIDATCDGDANGSIDITVADMAALAPSPFTWSGPTGFVNPGTEDVSGLTAGNYSVMVADTNGCIGTANITIRDSIGLTSTAVLVNTTCSYAADGSINLTPIDAIGMTSFVWTGPVGFVDPGTEDISGLASGTYCVVVTDANGCTLDTCFNINAPSPIIITPVTTGSQCTANTGTVNVSATGGTEAGVYLFDWDVPADPWGAFDDVTFQSGIGQGTYGVIAQDDNGCVDTAYAVVTNLNSPTVDFTSVIDVDCFGNNTGAVFVTISGGSPGYTQSWTGPGAFTSTDEDVNTLVAGTYEITVTDNSGCVTVADTTVNQPVAAISITGVESDLNCNAICDGSIDVTVTGGTVSGNYTYAWDTSPSTGIFSTFEDPSGLCVGDYEVFVTDDNGCIDSATFTLTQPSAFNFVSDSIPSSCGNADGEVSAVVTGGTVAIDYTYSWSPIAGATNTLSGIPAGCYQLLVTDDNLCQDSITICIADTNGPSIGYVVTPVNCYGDANGAIDVTLTGVPLIGSSWTGPGGFTAITEDISGLEAGTYTITATDGNGCVSAQPILVPGPLAPINATAVITNLTCYNDSSGSIAITLAGGNTPYASLNWSGPSGYTSTIEDINNLIHVGNYTLSVIDNNGCTLDTTFVLTQPDSIEIATVITEPTCGMSDGQIDASATGGDGNYTFTWVHLTGGLVIPPGPIAANIPAGVYQVTATDGNGCTTTENISISNALAPTVSGIVTDATCNGDNDGEIDVTASGVDNVFAWTADPAIPDTTQEDLINLPGGTYNVLVTDTVTGCMAAGSFDVNEPDLLTVNGVITHLVCNSDSLGAIDVTVAGGNGTNTFVWTGPIGFIDPGTEDMDSLAAGTYSLMVTDNLGCNQGAVFNVTEPNPILVNAVVTNVTCPGDSDGEIAITPTQGTPGYGFSWTGPAAYSSSSEDIISLVAGTYFLTITDLGGCSKDTAIVVNDGNPLIFNGAVVAATCGLSDGEASVAPSGGMPFTIGNPYTFAWSDTGNSTNDTITGQMAGAYIVTVYDSLCTYDTTLVITNPGAPEITFDSITDVTCFGGSDGAAYITVTGGSGNYTYVWNPNAVSQQQDLINQSAGTWTVQVTDVVMGCIVIGDTVIGTNSNVSGTPTVVNATCGDNDGSITIAGSGGTGNYTYLWPDNSVGTTWSNVSAGNYLVSVTDDAGCSNNVNVAVNNIGGPTAVNAVVTNATCGDSNDGAITVTPVGGSAPYNYFWPSIPSISNTINNLEAADYTVSITDSNGCIITDVITVGSPSNLVATGLINPATCGATDGQIAVTVTGGSGAITHSWSTGETTPSISNLAEGPYADTISDASGCTIIEIFYVPGESAADLSLIPVHLSCNGICLGQISSSVSGNVGAMSYQWFDEFGLPIPGETASTIDSLCVGEFVLEGIDAGNGCTSYAVTNVMEPDTMVLQIENTTPASCVASCDGTATVMPLGGTLPYNYVWNTVGDATPTADSLCVGLVSVMVTDANGCTAEQTMTIGENNTLTGAVTPTDATCGECDGEATVAPSGGSGSYTVTWFDGISNSHTDLCAGVYTIVINDANGCQKQMNVPINNIDGPTGETITQTNVSCAGGNDGAATVLPSGGTPPYTYLWVPGGQVTNTVSGLAANTYHVEMTDSNGCTRIAEVIITQPASINISTMVIDASCGSNNGSITLVMSGGTGPYTITWLSAPGALPSGNPVNNLQPGAYTVQVCDNSGCCVTKVIGVNSTFGPVLTTSSTSVQCYGACDGSATANVVNGASTYTYNWLNTGFVDAGAGNTSTDSPVCVGQQVVQVTNDATGCMSVAVATVLQPDTMIISVPTIGAASCFGICDGSASAATSGGTLTYTYAWSNSSITTANNDSLCAGASTVTVTDANGCTATQTVNVVQPTQILISIDTIINVTCPQSNDGEIQVSVVGGDSTYLFDWDMDGQGDFDDNEDNGSLFGGNYILVVQDGAGCFASDTFSVDTNTVVQVFVSGDTSYCAQNCVNLVASATGTTNMTLSWTDEYGNLLSLNDTLAMCEDTVGTGIYYFTAADGACIATDSVLVEVYGLPSAEAGDEVEDVIHNSAVLGGNPTSPDNVTYLWTPTTDFISLSDTSVANPSIDITTTSWYYVYVTDENGCMSYDSVLVIAIPEIIISGGLTNNGDGKNEVWVIQFIENYPDAVVEVYNRWGQQLFLSKNYIAQQFDGTYQGQQLPVGTYYYIITLNHPDFPNALTGPITIMR